MRRILVVDDDPQICLAVRAWLKRYGFRVSIADGSTNGLVALDTATFDLMIVDIFMPDMRGFESIRTFHERAPKVPLIAISGYAFSGLEVSGPDFLKMAVRLGATRCLRKPFKPTTLLGVIEAEPHRRFVATLAAVANAPSEPQGQMDSSQMSRRREESGGVSRRAAECVVPVVTAIMTGLEDSRQSCILQRVATGVSIHIQGGKQRALRFRDCRNAEANCSTAGGQHAAHSRR
jgi:CheY-like chemotaxis protein